MTNLNDEDDTRTELDESFKEIRLPVIEEAVMAVQGYKSIYEVEAQ